MPPYQGAGNDSKGRLNQKQSSFTQVFHLLLCNRPDSSAARFLKKEKARNSTLWDLTTAPVEPHTLLMQTQSPNLRIPPRNVIAAAVHWRLHNTQSPHFFWSLGKKSCHSKHVFAPSWSGSFDPPHVSSARYCRWRSAPWNRIWLWMTELFVPRANSPLWEEEENSKTLHHRLESCARPSDVGFKWIHASVSWTGGNQEFSVTPDSSGPPESPGL